MSILYKRIGDRNANSQQEEAKSPLKKRDIIMIVCLHIEKETHSIRSEVIEVNVHSV